MWKSLSGRFHTGENAIGEQLTWLDRIQRSWQSVKDIIAKVWLYVVIGIAVGAGIHGYVPESALAGIMGKQAWWSVFAAVLLGVPLYSNAAGVIPIVSALMEKGASLGTVLGVHDVGGRVEPARNDYFAAGFEATINCGIYRYGSDCYCDYRVFV